MYVRKFPANDDWIPKTITHTRWPLSFVIKLETGQVVCRHVNHLRHQTAVHKPEQITDWTDLLDVASTQAEHDVEPSQPEVPILWRSTRVSLPTQRYSSEDFRT